MKADCERAAVQHFGADVALVRPTYVIGGHDATLRFPYWVARARRGGTIAAPGPRGAALQYIDARDLGAFLVALVTSGASGAYLAVGPRPAARFVATIEEVARQVGPPGTEVVEVTPKAVQRAGLETRFPLWSGGVVSEHALAMDPSKALAAGLTLRPLADSIDDVVAWWGDRPWPDHWLTGDAEGALLAEAATTSHGSDT